jgi:prepilin-type N-terminal cleavage/methylation domain-containing protein
MRNSAGFSLIEVMISLVVFGIVLAGVVGMFTSTSSYHTAQEMMVEVTQNVRAAKNIMVDEIRSAGCNPRDQIRVGFQRSADDRFNTDANSIHFTRDIDSDNTDAFLTPDGQITLSEEEIAYYRTNDDCDPLAPVGPVLAAGNNTPGCLRRQAGGGTTNGTAIMPFVTDLQFQYFDANNNSIAPATLTTNSRLDNIRTVAVLISGQVENPNRVSAANRQWTQQFRVRVRNM